MTLKRTLLIIMLLPVIHTGLCQKAIFLHHSTGWAVYSEGRAAERFDSINKAQATSYVLDERSFPDSPYPWDNYPYDYWNLWINNACGNSNPGIACMDNLCAAYDVIIFKHCYPGSAITDDPANPSAGSPVKSIANYKLQYRALRDLMDSYPENKFIVWTLAPLHRLATNTQAASKARQFVEWVKNDWLSEDGKNHPNIYIFDFWGYMAESDPSPALGKVNCLKYEFEFRHENTDDSHPNTSANEYAGPLFAEFIVKTIADIPVIPTSLEDEKSEYQFNWSSDAGNLVVRLNDAGKYASLQIFDVTGKQKISQKITGNMVNVVTNTLTPGIYIASLVGINNRSNFKILKK